MNSRWLCKRWYVYADSSGRMWDCGIEYNQNKQGRVWIVGADLYNPDGEYKGFWPRSSMPLKVLEDMRKFVKEELKEAK